MICKEKIFVGQYFMQMRAPSGKDGGRSVCLPCLRHASRGKKVREYACACYLCHKWIGFGEMKSSIPLDKSVTNIRHFCEVCADEFLIDPPSNASDAMRLLNANRPFLKESAKQFLAKEN